MGALRCNAGCCGCIETHYLRLVVLDCVGALARSQQLSLIAFDRRPESLAAHVEWQQLGQPSRGSSATRGPSRAKSVVHLCAAVCSLAAHCDAMMPWVLGDSAESPEHLYVWRTGAQRTGRV